MSEDGDFIRESTKHDELRQQLLTSADMASAARLAGELHDALNDQLNAAGVTVATSLLARALIGRAVIGTAAAWWSDLGLPEPLTYAAIKSIVDDLPPELTPICFIDPDLVD